jgi:hypothetical protein
VCGGAKTQAGGNDVEVEAVEIEKRVQRWSLGKLAAIVSRAAT